MIQGITIWLVTLLLTYFVIGVLERGGKVRTKHIPNTKKRTVQDEVREHVEPGSTVNIPARRGA